jgi:predicted permease
MRRLRELILRFGGLFNKQRKDRELEEEIESHLQFHIEDNLRLGMTPEEARRQALIKLGGIESTKEAYRDQRGLPVLESLLRDIRYGARMLRKNPGFTAVAVLTLALGIGANTAIFSVVNAVLLRPLPYRDADRLVRIASVNPSLGLSDSRSSGLNVLDWQRGSTLFESIAAFQEWDGVLTFNGKSVPARVNWVTPNLMPMLGLKPLLGTLLQGGEEPESAVVLPYGIWAHQFGGDPAVIGKPIVETGMRSTIVGVLPPSVAAPAQGAPPLDQAFVRMNLPQLTYPRDRQLFNVVGRLKPGVSVAQAQAELSGVAAELERLYPDTNRGWGVKVTGLKIWMLAPVRDQLLTVYAATGIILLIASLNVSNLLLIRGEGRRKELAIRCALGSTRWQLARQLFIESLVLAAIGGLAGLLLAFGCRQVLLSFAPVSLGIQHGSTFDWPVLASALIAAILAALLFGLFPALRLSRENLNQLLRESGRSTSPGRTRHRWLNGLVAGQIAISTVLLVAAGLVVASFQKLLRVDPGFVKQNTLSFRVGMLYDQETFRRVLETLSALPGVQSVGGSHVELLNDVFSHPIRITIDGKAELSGATAPTVNIWLVTQGFFHAAGIPLIAGRTFDARDDENAPDVVVINEALAKRFFPNEDAVGKLVRIPNSKDSKGDTPRRIIGVVGSVRQHGLREAAVPILYRHYTRYGMEFDVGSFALMVRTKENPIAIMAAIRAAIKEANPELVMTRVATGEQIVDRSLAGQRFATLLMLVFAALGTLLAAVGLYGVLTYAVSQRSQEIGIRMALGAQHRHVLRMVLRQGMAVVAVGIAAGSVGGLALGRLMRSQLFNVSPADPATFVIIAVLLSAVALLACWLPARRATKVDPMEALRHE